MKECGRGKAMTNKSPRLIGALAAAAVLCSLPIAVAGQAPARPATPKSAAAVAKTPWGDPDLQGIWSNTTTTPLERLREAGDKAVLSEDEREALSRRVQERLDQDKPGANGSVVPYNEFWYERGTLNNRTALIVDPEDGRIPPLTAEGQKRWEAQLANRKQHAADSWLDRSTYDRCITRGMPGAMVPGFYN